MKIAYRNLFVLLILFITLIFFPANKGRYFVYAKSAFSGGDGTINTPYEISSVADLRQLAIDVNSGWSYGGEYFKLITDLDLQSYDVEDKKGWMPIGNSYDKVFGGNFDGNNHIIKNIYINRPSQRFIGIFGYNVGEISNISVVDGNIIGADPVGSIAGSNKNGVIENCYSNSSITGTIQVGGISGANSGTITNCKNNGNVYAKGEMTQGSFISFVGGIVGNNSSGSIIGSQNNGNILADGDCIGGIAGGNNWYSFIKNCFNTKDISSTCKNVGGIVGYNAYSSIKSCFNTGNIQSSDSNIGGIFGMQDAVGSSPGEFKSCYNTGSISGRENIGGIGGYNHSGSYLQSCYNTGNIQGGKNIGGIAGRNKGYIRTCLSLSDIVTGTENVGRVAGNSVFEENIGNHLEKNYALFDMTGGSFLYKGLNDLDGEDAYRMEVSSKMFWEDIWTNATDFYMDEGAKLIAQDNKMPIFENITGQSDAMLLHLAGNIIVRNEYIFFYNISQGGEAKLELKPLVSVPDSFNIFAIKYTNRKISSVAYKKVNCTTNKITPFSFTIPTDGNTGKVMIWKESMRPFTDSIEF